MIIIVYDYQSLITEPLLPVPDDAVMQRHLGRQGLFRTAQRSLSVAGSRVLPGKNTKRYGNHYNHWISIVVSIGKSKIR